MNPDYKIFSQPSELPNQSEPISVVYQNLRGATDVSEYSSEVLVATYRDGHFDGDEEYYDSCALDTLPEGKLQDQVYVQDCAEHAHNHLYEYTEIYNKCIGNMDEISKVLEEELSQGTDEDDED